MRSDPRDFPMLVPATLQEALNLLSSQPTGWLPIAGGTDVMVQFGAGTLGRHKLLSIWNLPELRRVEVLPREVRIGAGCTYTDLRRHDVVACEFPILALAAGWTGGIANQNRGTLAGNIVNASPAADSLPPLLVYEAELIVISARGERRIRYGDFHTGYKQMNLAADELIRTICLPRRYSGYLAYARKIGARSAQAIAKVCIAGLAKAENGIANDVRIAVGSVAPTPIRLRNTEQVLNGKVLDRDLVRIAQRTAMSEISPIRDIRSTVEYRTVVTGNLVAEFLEKLRTKDSADNQILEGWNALSAADAENAILPCCGSRSWARNMAGRRPFHNSKDLLAAADEVWRALPEADWMDAFRSHPRIGESRIGTSTASRATSSQSAEWSTQEQSKVASSADDWKAALAEANKQYEERFGHIFIVCASGKSAAEILEILRMRLQNDGQTELQEAAEQQRRIMQIRLQKWLAA